MIMAELLARWRTDAEVFRRYGDAFRESLA
jgi:hypothetical protein